MAITGNDLLKKRRGTTNDGEKTEKFSGNDLLEMRKTYQKYQGTDTSAVNDAYIDSFYNDWNSFSSSAKNDFDSVGWGNASSLYDSKSAAWKDLSARADVLAAYFYKNRNNFTDADKYASTMGGLNEIRSSASDILKSFQAEADYYSNFATEDEFNEWNKYSYIPESSDFAEKSKYVSTYRGGEKYNAFANMYTDTGFDDIMYDYINRDENARQIKAVNDISNNSSFLGFDKSERREMSDEEISIFNYIYATQGKDAAYEYVDHITAGPVGLNARQREKETEAWASYAKESPVASSVFSVLEAPLKGLSYIGQAADYISDGKIDQNAGYNKFSYINSAIRNQVTQDVEKNWGGVGSFAYQTGMSMADFLFTTAVSGGNSALSLGIMGTGAAADTVIYAKDRGLSDTQAFALGTIAGAAEIVTEKISLDTLLDATQLGKNALGYIAKNMLAEGSEEVFSSAINLIADVMISRDKSEWREAIDAYKAVGMSDKEAFWHAVGDQALSLGLDFLGGAISGGVMGGGGVALNAVNTAAQGADLKQNGYEAGKLTGEYLKINPENHYAQKMQGRLDKGKALSNYQLGKLYQQNETELYSQDMGKIKSAAEVKLTELGEIGNISKLADIVTKVVAGEQLTYSEKSALKKNQNALQVLSDLNPGNKDSGWTGNIGTNRINAEAYGRNIPAEVEATAVAAEAEQAEANTVTEGEVIPDKDGVIPDTRSKEEQAPTVAVEASAGTVNQTETVSAPEAEHIPELTEMVSEGEHSVDVNNMPSETTADTVSEESSVSLQEVSAKYGDQAQAMVRTYQEGQDVQQYDSAYQMAYDMGRSGVSLSYVMNSKSTEYLTKQQRELAYEAGQAAAGIMAKAQHETIKAAANGKTGRKKGTVKGEGVTMADLKKTFNDTQNRAYRILAAFAEATGVDIVLYQSKTNENGDFVGAQGKFKRADDKIYIDINAGLQNIKDADDLAKYAMLRTFSHEFTHFLEKYNAVWYNDFRKVVFETLTARGEDANELIETKQAQHPGMDYDKASREVIAEAMTDILPDSQFIETLANKHKNIFTKLHEMLKEFLADIKAYFKSIGHNPSREANALKEQVGEAVRYVDNIVKMFDEGAEAAVDNYQMTVATDETTKISENIEKTSHSQEKYEKEATEYDEKREKKRTEDADTGGNSNDEGASARTFEKNGNGSGISKELGEAKSQLPQSSADERQHRNEEIIRSLLNQENYISPKKGSPLYEAQRILTEEYATECHILKATAWKNENFACAYNGKIYISENIDEDTLKSLVPHESTHIMKQKDFMPYRDFIDNSPQLIDYTTDGAQKLFDLISDHIGYDVFETEDISLIRKYYDELNAVVYGIQQGGLVYDKEFDYEWIPGAFLDFDAYISELSDIHEQYKAEIKAKKNADKKVKPEAGTKKSKSAGTKKSDWTAHDVEWRIPGKKTPIAYSSRATSDLIEALAEDDPTATIKDLLGKVRYDQEVKKVLQQYIDSGHGDQIADDWFNHDKDKEKSNAETTGEDVYDEIAQALYKTHPYEIGGFKFDIQYAAGSYHAAVMKVGAKSRLHTSDSIATYKDAVDYIVSFARKINLLKDSDTKASETPAVAPEKPQPVQEAKEEPKPSVEKAETAYDYNNIALELEKADTFKIDNVYFSIVKVREKYKGYLKRMKKSPLDTTTRELSLYSEPFENRQDAVNAVVMMAKLNRLFGNPYAKSNPNEETKPSVKKVEAIEEKNIQQTPVTNEVLTTSTEKVDDQSKTPSEKLADSLLYGYLNTENINKSQPAAITSKDLYALADEAFGGTQAEGKYDRKDAYDAMELAVNKFLLQYAAMQSRFVNFNGNTTQAVSAVKKLEHLLSVLPTQSVRTQEMEEFQQFSTPPNIAYLAAWAANISANDFVLEPSAGIGGLAVFAKAWGAEVAVNELSKRRLEVLRSMGFDHLFNENAEHIDNILPANITPSVVIMNPPFSSTAGRLKNNKTSNAEKHIDQALARLRDGGRLVAILGQGMNNADYYKYWDKLRKSFNIRANLSIDGSNYRKYGTTYGVQIVVIDKTGPQVGETVTGTFTDLTEIPKVLEGIRNDRSSLETNRTASTDDSIRESVSDGRNEHADTGHQGVDERAAGSSSGNERGKNRKGSDGNEGAGNRTDVKRPEKSGSKKTERKDGGTDRDSGRTDSGNGAGATESSVPDGHQSELPLPRLNETSEPEEVSDDGVYAMFVSPEIPVKGGKKHPAVLVESAAMAAVSMPKATYEVHLPADVIANNLSEAQLVTVTYAGQAHEQMLPDKRRKGFFIGDGTGVGKGRQIAGIILDNFMQGRKKAVWISKNNDLFGDAVRDWTATTGRSKDEVFSHSKIKSGGKITNAEGILFSTYDTLKSEKGGNRLEQIVSWLGEDFDGVIAFDEAHAMGNLFGKKSKFGKSKGSLVAQAGVELQRRLPNARIVYVSATAATEVDNLAYAERIGLWGPGTAFNNAQDFISKIGSSGLAAMELVIRDMKAMGSYVARSISYNGVNYDTVEHALDPMQTEIYNTMSRAWQKTMANVQSALETTGGKYNSTARQKALGNFYSSMQRFYNQVLTSMSMPSVIADMKKELAAGHSCVLQIVNTNEAQQNKKLAEAKANGDSLDDLDLTPRESLIGYLMNSFPTQMYEEYTDDDGNIKSRPVMDSKGNPVQDKDAIRKRDSLIDEVNQMSIPDGPLEMLFDVFGTEMVAENTGRSRRVVPKKQSDGSVSRVEERRTLNHRTADVQAFQDGKKRVLVFSDAGGTGKSYHADRTEKNQQLRIHYVLQPGWVASNAVQGFGRTHRSNEASAPVYKLVTTNIKGQKRFTSTIARRLDQLGALTKGQRDTGSGMFGAKDNLETDLAMDSLREFYRRLGKNKIEGIDGMKTLERLGLREKFSDEYGGFKLDEKTARDIGTFLNRILALEVDEQNTIFDSFISIYEMELEAAIQAGTLDTGMENVKADKIEVIDDKIIRGGKNTSADTHYIQAKTYKKPKIVTDVDSMSKMRTGFMGIYKTKNGAVRAVYRIADKTTEWGAVQKQFRLVGPNQGASTRTWNEAELAAKATEVDKAEWQKEWDAEVAKVPEYNEDTIHMLTGALLPIWNSLPQEGSTKVKRLITDKGDAYLGRVISKDMIDTVLGRFDIDRTMEVYSAKKVMENAIQKGVHFYLTNSRTEIFRSRVSGEWRLEITQPYNTWYLKRTYPELIQERISYRDRFFIPVGENGEAVLERILTDNPVRNTSDDVQEQSREYLADEQYQQRTKTLTDREILEMASHEIDVGDLSEAEKGALDIFQKRLEKLKELQEKRAEQGRLYKEQQFGENPDRKEAKETLERMRLLDSQIRKATADVLTVEEKEVLRRVLTKARKVVETQQKKYDKEILDRWRDRRNNAAAIKKYRERLRGDVDELYNWITSPDNKDITKHVPDVLKNTVIPFLGSINFMSKRSLKGGDATNSDKAFIERLAKLKEAIKTNMDIDGMYSGYNDLPEDFIDRLDTFIKSANALLAQAQGEFIINQMTAEELKELSQIVRTLKKYIVMLNLFHNNAMFRHVYEAGDESVEKLKGMVNASNKTGTISNFLFWQQIRPAYAFERFGEGGKSIYDELRAGQAKLAFNTKEIERFAKEAYTAKEVQSWENEIITFEFGEDTVKIPVSYIMSFYELYKDKDARRHIEGDGIRVATYTHKGKKISDVGHVLARVDIDKLIQFVEDNPRIKEVADNLQKYMAEQGGKWGNHVSVARFGEEKFTNKTYFPINSDGRHLSANLEEHPSAAALYALLNMSFTKSRNDKANNRIVLYSIFDVFANHMASMAQYNAMALPVLDAVKWFNYKQVLIDEDGTKTVTGNLREQMDRVYGVPEEKKPGSGKRGYAQDFIINIIKSFNGTAAQGTPYDSFGLKSLHRYNMAQVAYNLRVAIQQPMAITRAAMLIDYNSIRKGLSLNPATIKKNVEEMQKYSGIAAWKSLGFYDVNISRGLTSLIKHDDTFLEKIGDFGMLGAEKLDTWTWAAMWSACKEEVIKKKKLKPSDSNFYDEVTKLFEDVIYKTQVVDSILTKNEFMRDKGAWARLVGSFMSESTTNASMLLNAVDKYNLDMKQGMTKKQAWQKNKNLIGRTFYVYGVGAVILAAFQAVADAWRDDDDYENYGEKWLDAFVGNVIDELAPFNKLPIVSDFYELGKEILSVFGVDTYGNPPQSVFMQWYDSLVKGTEIIYDKIMGENTNYTWWGGIFKLLQAASGATGIAGANATRELISAWNTLIVPMAPSLRLETYGPSSEDTRNALYEAIIAGDTKEVARIEAKYKNRSDINTAIRKALRENDPRIKEAAQAKFNGDIAKYTRITDAIFADGKFTEKDIVAAINAEIDAMIEKPESEPSDKEVSRYKIEDYYTSITGGDNASAYAVKNDLIETEIANGKDRDEAEKSFNSSLTSYIQDEFKKGNVTESRAKSMLSYAGWTSEEAASKVQYWSFKKNYPDYDLNESAVSKYYTDVKPAGISLSVYYNYTKKAAKATGVDSNGDGKADNGTVKNEIMWIIHSLPISSYQKDVLYRVNGWAESTLYQAPWH